MLGKVAKSFSALSRPPNWIKCSNDFRSWWMGKLLLLIREPKRSRKLGKLWEFFYSWIYWEISENVCRSQIWLVMDLWEAGSYQVRLFRIPTVSKTNMVFHTAKMKRTKNGVKLQNQPVCLWGDKRPPPRFSK